MSVRVGTSWSHPLTTRGAALAAATVIAGAGLFGVATVGPQISGAPVAQAQYNVALTAFPTFAESLQALLDNMGMGDLNAVLGGFGTFTVDSPVSLFLAGLNPNGDTLGGVADLFGLSLSEPLYSTTGDSLLGTGSLFLVDGVPIGNLDLGDLVDVVLGDGAGSHSLTDLAGAVGLGSMLSQYGSLIGTLGLENENIINVSLLGVSSHPALTAGSSLVDWLSGILGHPTTDITKNVDGLLGIGGTSTVQAGTAWTLGEYLHTLPSSEGSSTMMDQATLADLFHLAPNQPWDQYLDSLPFGGTLLDPSGDTIGEQTLATFLSSFLPDDSTLSITGATTVTDFLEAFGLLNW